MQELLARGQMVSAGGRKPRPSEAKENAELERREDGRRGEAGLLPWGQQDRQSWEAV